MKMTIKEMIGPRCIIREDGQKVYDAIYPLLQRGGVFSHHSGNGQFIAHPRVACDRV